jgi:hypothetical protein
MSASTTRVANRSQACPAKPVQAWHTTRCMTLGLQSSRPERLACKKDLNGRLFAEGVASCRCAIRPPGGRTTPRLLCSEAVSFGNPKRERGTLRSPQVTTSSESKLGPSLTLRVTIENSPVVRKNHSLSADRSRRCMAPRPTRIHSPVPRFNQANARRRTVNSTTGRERPGTLSHSANPRSVNPCWPG